MAQKSTPKSQRQEKSSKDNSSNIPSITTCSPQKSTQLQSPTKQPVKKTKSDTPGDGFGAKVLLLEETIIGYVHNLSNSRRNKRNTHDYCTFVLQTSATETQQALLYSPHKRPLVQESHDRHTPVKLKYFTYTSEKDKIIANDMTNISTPQQCEHSFQYEEFTLGKSDPVNILHILNTYKEWEIVTVHGKVLNVKPHRTVRSPRKRF